MAVKARPVLGPLRISWGLQIRRTFGGVSLIDLAGLFLAKRLGVVDVKAGEDRNDDRGHGHDNQKRAFCSLARRWWMFRHGSSPNCIAGKRGASEAVPLQQMNRRQRRTFSIWLARSSIWMQIRLDRAF
ncbi:hypothetical protein [Bosea sp. UNC402CLCol]|uniref:hypothetical protein n=1 Tax=Bosea sp. UNC402CLCol TaxID=1510531 RepID=UPI0012E09963|nr:hypothetical protein [Bosea sp. UNC402CLCol]